MAVSAHDVARELRNRRHGAGNTQVQKWLYYCQGWHLAWTGEPLFLESIEAWTNGPVVAELWADEKYERGKPDPQAVSGDGLAIIEYVLKRYGGYSGAELIKMTHGEAPWLELAENEDVAASTPSPEIQPKALQQWFAQDDAFVERAREVDRLRKHTEAYAPGPPRVSDAYRDAVRRVLDGERIVETRPA